MTNIKYTPNGQCLLYESPFPDKFGKTYMIQGIIDMNSSKDDPRISEIYGWRRNLRSPSDGGTVDVNFYLPTPRGASVASVLYGKSLTPTAAQKYADFLVEHYNL